MADAVERPVLEAPAGAVQRLRYAFADEDDSRVAHDVRISRIWVQRPVESLEVRRDRRARPWCGSVEAPYLAQRAVPELEQVDTVRILDLLTDVERGSAVRRTIEPRRILVHVHKRRIGESARGFR